MRFRQAGCTKARFYLVPPETPRVVKPGHVRNRNLEASSEGLADWPRSGRPRTYTDADRKAIWEQLRNDPPVGQTATPRSRSGIPPSVARITCLYNMTCANAQGVI